MDLASIIGTVLALLSVAGGALLGGLGGGDLVGGAAALVVFGGTAAATLVSFPLSDVKRAVGLVPLVFRAVPEVPVGAEAAIAEIVRVAALVRKDGVLAVEGQRASLKDPLFARAVRYVVEGVDAATVRDLLGRELELEREREDAAASVWEAAGGYAPSVGILGAVLGLIQVMRSLDDPAKIGAGIAAAFLATVYGLALSSLVLAPWGAKIRRKAALLRIHKEVVRQGVAGIQEGAAPPFLQEKLEAIIQEGSPA